MSQSSSHCTKWQMSFKKKNMIFHCAYKPHFLSSFMGQCALQCFYVLAIVNNAEMKEYLQVSLRHPLKYITRSIIDGWHVNSAFDFCVCMCVCVLYVWIHTSCYTHGCQGTPCTVWVSEIELKLAGLQRVASSHEAPHQQFLLIHSRFFTVISLTEHYSLCVEPSYTWTLFIVCGGKFTREQSPGVMYLVFWHGNFHRNLGFTY